MSRIEEIFKGLDRPALVSFITAGDPDYDTSLATFKALADSGADIIELGMPFTDPMADGPVIQLASERALAAGGSMVRTFDMVRSFRVDNAHTPIVLMGYFNPLMQYGIEAFAKDAAEAGVDGLIIVDLPPEESDALIEALDGAGVDFIRLITPTTDEARLQTLLKGASGFLYYVSITGVTGAASANLDAVGAHIKQIKAHTDLPVAIGFGIRSPQDAAEMGKIGDAVVVGSALVQALYDDGVDAVTEKARALSDALKA